MGIDFKYGDYTLEGLDKLYKRNEIQPVIKEYIMGEKLKEEEVPIEKKTDNKLIERINSPRKKREIRSTKNEDFVY